MENEFWGVTDGTFTLQETEKENQFYFFRNDGGILTDVGIEPVDFYHAYIMQKMMNGEIKGAVMGNIRMEMSEDETCMRLTICDFTEIQENDEQSVSEGSVGENEENIPQKQPENFLKRLFHKIFG